MSDICLEIDSEINELYAKTSVLQEFSNSTDSPLELRIYLYKNRKMLFDSFSAKIGKSIEVSSKVIKKEKAENKYTDSIASGNAAIFATEDEKRIIINMGNIPPKEKVIFKTKFIQFIEFSKKYEFELFRNLPIFEGKKSTFHNSNIKGKVFIKGMHQILNIEKEILMDSLNIIEEKYLDNENKNYLINYQIENLPKFNFYNLEYIPSSKIYFEFKINYPIIYCQNSSLEQKEKNYCIKYKYKKEKSGDDDLDIENSPRLFIFLLDQSGSMSGEPIEIAKQALKLFLQSLPVGSYYQLVGFGSNYVKYDKEPKEYTQKNISEALKTIEKLDANMGGTEIYDPLLNIYDSYETYDKIHLPKYIFLLTDGEIDNKESVIRIIEENNMKFWIYSIGIGNSYDKDLIKNAGIIGKGNYNFCENLENLNSVVVSEIRKTILPFIVDLNIKSNLEKKNIIKSSKIKNVIKENELITLNYIIDTKKAENKIEIDLNYLDHDKKKVKNKFYLIPEEIPKGEELSKLIMKDYILKNKELTEQEKKILSIKYQILNEYTSLFTEINLDKNISNEMKSQIIGDKGNNIILPFENNIGIKEPHKDDFVFAEDDDIYDFDPSKIVCEAYGEEEDIKNDLAFGFNPSKIRCECYIDNLIEEKDNKELIETKNNKKLIEEKENKELIGKEKIMKMINTQDFIQGFWEENTYTKIIKDKYLKEYNLLKGMKNIKISDRAAITILIILYIYKENPNLLNELFMIIQKAKIFIKKETKNSYDNIIKKLGI